MKFEELKTKLKGISLDLGKSLIETAGFKSRITSQDGKNFLSTMDFNPNRVNLSVENNLIVDVENG